MDSLAIKLCTIHTAVNLRDNIKLKLNSKYQEAIGTELSSGGIASRHQQKTPNLSRSLCIILALSPYNAQGNQTCYLSAR